MIVLLHLERAREAQARGDLHVVIGQVVAVAAAAVCLDEEGLGQVVVAHLLHHVVLDALGVAELLFGEDAVLPLDAKAERDVGVDHRLTAHGFAIPVVRDIDGGEDLQVGTPFDGGAGARLVGGLDMQGLLLGADDLALLEVQLILVAVTPYGDVHVLGGVLRGARAQAVGAQREVVVAALVVVVFAARVQLAEHQLPVEALLGGVPVKRAAAAVVLHLDGAVGEGGEGDQIAVALTRLVDRVRQDLERGMSTAIQAVGAEYDRRAKTYAFLVLQLADAVVAVIDRAFCHTVLSLLVFPLWCVYRKLPQGLPAPQQHHGKNIVHLFAD